MQELDAVLHWQSLKHWSSVQPDLTCRLAASNLGANLSIQPSHYPDSQVISPPPRPAPAPRQPSPICCKHISWKSGLDLNYVYESVRQKFRPGGIWFQMFWHVLPFKHKPQLQEGISPLRGMECYGRWCGQANLNLNLSLWSSSMGGEGGEGGWRMGDHEGCRWGVGWLLENTDEI